MISEFRFTAGIKKQCTEISSEITKSRPRSKIKPIFISSLSGGFGVFSMVLKFVFQITAEFGKYLRKRDFPVKSAKK